MALHPDITRKDDVSLALETAVGAMLLSTRQQTSNAGSVTIPNADGTKTVMGADAGDTTVAKFVGDTTAPGKPTGITALSHMRTVFVSWDGSLDGGVPKDFLLVRLHLSYAGEDGSAVESDLGDLYGPGGAASVNLPEGTVVTVTARAYDDAHDAFGLSRPNVSDSCDPITVTVVDEAAELKRKVEADIKVVSDKADEAQGVADDAAAANTKLREDTAASLETVNTKVAGVRSDVDKASQAAATAQSGVDAANTKITQTSDKVDGLTTTVSNVSKTADDAMALSTTNHQDLTGFQQSVQQTYSTKQDTLSQVSAVSQKADAISASLSKDYQKKTDADATYATKTALQATASGITASVSETYATKSVVQALQNIADNAIETWQGHGVPSMTGEPTSDWTTPELKKQHSGDMYYDLDTGYSYRFGSADGSTYTWDKISDSDITRAMQAAADAQSAADKANAGVSKLNTDIPATYATKSDVKITTDGIKTDVSKAMTLGQTGIDNAASVDQKADGIQATVTQQAQTIGDNVKAIAQVNMRADSLSTSISQVNTKTDVALANAANYVKNPQFHGSNLDSVRTTQMDASDSNAGTLPAAASTYGKNTGGYYCIADAVRIRAIAGHTYRIEIDSKPASDMPSTETEPFGLMYWCMAADNSGITANQYAMINTTATTVTDWTHSKMEFTYAGTEPWSVFRPAYRAKAEQKWLVTNFTCTDVTEVVAAQSSANGALSQVSTLSQDLSGFKTSVGQTYETKTDSTAKNTAFQQNLDGFKTSVASTYASKSDVAATYATKSDVTQTSDSLTSQISAVGTDATSALNKATTAQQNLDGFRNTVSATYATKIALDTTNGNVTQAQATGDQAIFAALPSLADKTQANSWLCSIFPTGKGSVETLPSYSLIASLAASDTKYSADSGDILRGGGIDYHYGLIRTLVSFSADKTWTFTYSHDDGSRIYVDGVNVFESAAWTNNDPVTISFTKGNHIVDVMYANGSGWYGIWSFSVPLSSIATTMFAPAGASVLAETYSTKSYADQTAKSISLGVVEEYKNGQHGSALATQSDISIAKDFITSTVSQTYATRSALSDTNENVSNANNAANLALANAENLVANGSGKSMDTTWGNNGVTSDGTVFSRTFPGGENHVDFLSGTLSKAPIQGRVYRISIDVRLASGVWPGGGFVFGVGGNWTSVGVTSASSDWETFTRDYTVPENTNSQWYMSSYMPGNAGSGVIQFRNLSVKDVTEVAALRSDVAATYATQSSVQQTASQITQQVASTYATQQDVTSKYTTLQQTDNAFDARIGTAQSTAANAQSNAANAQNRAGVLETLIHSDANGVRVGKTVNGSYTGYSALVNANGSFDVLNPASDAIARFNSDNLAYRYGGQWYSVVSGFKHVATASDLPATSVEQDRCIVDDVRRENVYQNGVWKNRSMLVNRYTFTDAAINPVGHVFMSVYYDFPTGMVTCIVDWDREIHLPTGNNTWTFGTGYPKAIMPSHILDDANNFQMIVASSQSSIVTIKNTGEVQLSTQRWNTNAMSHLYSGPATFPAAGGAWLISGQDF